MKKAYILLAGILLSLSAISQNVPQKMSYQSVIRNSNNELVVNQSCNVGVKIIKVTTSGNQNVYVENHSPVITNANGLLSLQIGNGTPTSGSFSAINWSDGPFSIEITTTPAGQTAVTTLSELLTVPYAINSVNATNATNATNAINAITAANGNPVGTIIAFGGNTIPTGYLECNGESKLSSAYPELSAVLGNSWGLPSGTNFILPDLRGLFLRGVTGSSPNDPDVNTRTFTGANANAVGSMQMDTLGSHTHTAYQTRNNNTNVDNGGYSWPNETYVVQTAPTGGNETRPRNAYVRYIIKY